MMGSAGVGGQGLDLEGLAASLACRRPELIKMLHPAGVVVVAYESRASTAIAVGFCDVSAHRREKRGPPQVLGSLRGDGRKSLPHG